MSSGPQSLNANRVNYSKWAVDTTVLAGADPSTSTGGWVPLRASHTIYLTHLSVATTTDHAATLTVQDSAGTPVVLAKTKSSPGLGIQSWDFGEDGTPATAAKGLDLVASAAGLGARVHAEGYYKPSSTQSA